MQTRPLRGDSGNLSKLYMHNMVELNVEECHAMYLQFTREALVANESHRSVNLGRKPATSGMGYKGIGFIHILRMTPVPREMFDK